MSTVTVADSSQRDEHQVLVPWVRFLWDAYRTVIDTLKHNGKLEHTYHATVARALQFCKKYKRQTELKRLCELLRAHIIQVQKYQNSNDKRRSQGVELTQVNRWNGLIRIFM